MKLEQFKIGDVLLFKNSDPHWLNKMVVVEVEPKLLVKFNGSKMVGEVYPETVRKVISD